MITSFFSQCPLYSGNFPLIIRANVPCQHSKHFLYLLVQWHKESEWPGSSLNCQSSASIVYPPVEAFFFSWNWAQIYRLKSKKVLWAGQDIIERHVSSTSNLWFLDPWAQHVLLTRTHEFSVCSFFFFIYFWLCRVLAAARRIFVGACRIFCCSTRALRCRHGLLSSCGVQVFYSLVVAHRLQGTRAQ